MLQLSYVHNGIFGTNDTALWYWNGSWSQGDEKQDKMGDHDKQ